jgi:hypothetical protein
MGEITARGRIPLLVGGTMLYYKALREGLSDLPEADPALRREIEDAAARDGWPALHAELARLDPDAAARLEPKDAQRIQRALEIVRLTGQPLAASYARRESAADTHRLIPLALTPSDRAVLHARIERRFDAMLLAGFVDEVENAAPPLPARRQPALHALRRLPPGPGIPGRPLQPGHLPRQGHLRHPPARQAPDHLAAQLPRKLGRSGGVDCLHGPSWNRQVLDAVLAQLPVA